MCVAQTVVDAGSKKNAFPNFSPVEDDDQPLIHRYIEKYQPQSCEYSFANLYCWKEQYDVSWTIYDGRMVIYDGVNQCSFFPLGKEMRPEELVQFSLEMKKGGRQPNIGIVPYDYIEKYSKITDFYTISEDRDSAEYIYSVDALCELKGSKLHKKKNLISQFKRKYPDFSIKPLAEDSIDKVRLLADQIYNSHERFLPGIENEHIALMSALDHFKDIGLKGLVLYAGDVLVGFSIFSRLNRDSFDIHFEKSCFFFKGAAQTINHATAEHLKKKCRYLNREQDLGIQGLRQAKKSYKPLRLLKMHHLILK